MDLRLVTLLSDFGLEDVYVGVMKGMIARINPKIKVIDLTHQIPPQNLALASFQLLNAYPYFPEGTVHIGVVDPGVGSRRRAIALQTAAAFFVGPDNGIFSGILNQSPVIEAVSLTQARYWAQSQPSTTFHGRDIFAPVAAHLASGVPLQEFGNPIDPTRLQRLDLSDWQSTASGARGFIQAIDHFGNLITNIPGGTVDQQRWQLQIKGQTVPGVTTYSSCPPGQLLALVGSHGWLEVAVRGGNGPAISPMSPRGRCDYHLVHARIGRSRIMSSELEGHDVSDIAGNR